MKKMFFLLVILMFLVQACGGTGGNGKGQNLPDVADATQTGVPINVNITKPVSGTEQIASGHDNEESAIASQKAVREGENYDKNRFERPFTAPDMNYVPDVDIKEFSMTKDANFYYVKIILAGVNPQTNTASGHYGTEIDFNLDGRSDLLIVTKSALSTDWSRDGVAVYIDSNGDVGGLRATHADPNYTGNGFDTIIFDSGQGDQPDLAWARQITGPGKAIVEIAIKATALQNNKDFLFDVIASTSPIEPGQFYYSDSMSQAAAGSPVRGEFYPVKGLSAFDNTCRIPVGFVAAGTEPLGCLVTGPEQIPPPTPIPGKG
ncbi:MAG: hypothetical protein HY258_11165 [Chloroflexi bacterium]|nr:hypothetical protein [Chloroflexota bacterium]